jgi:hypothetical protein
MKFEHNNISPLDNRYSNKISEIESVFRTSLNKNKIYIEINWLLFLCKKYPNYFNKISNPQEIKLLNLEIILMIKVF